MPPKKKDPPAGQRSIAAFFSPKPAGIAKAVDPASQPSKLCKPAGAADTGDAKAKAAPSGASPAPVAPVAPAVQPPAPRAEAATAAAAAPPPSCSAAVPAAAADGSQGSVAAAGREAVGRSIRVYWADDDAWYEGTVTRFEGRKHLVVYEDGDEEWLELGAEKFEWVEGRKLGAAAARKRKATVIESDSDEEPEASGSKYQASLGGDESEDESLGDAEAEEDAEMADSDASPGATKSNKTRAGRGSKAGAKRGGKASGGASSKAASKGAGAKQAGAAAAATPGGVAVDTSLGLTPPGSGIARGGGGASTAARPPRPPGAKTPATGVKTPGGAALLRSALDGGATPSAIVATPGSALKEAVAADAERFSVREVQRFPFLHPSKIRDANKRRPGEEGYDPSTVLVPPDFFKQNKVSEGQKQWWDFKAWHYDSVLLFKMGKFYELFEMDAHVGAEVLGLSYMKGDQPHCGFPEAAYHQMAETLARAGKKVVVIEQTETPDQLALRNEERRRQGLKKDNVVRREKVAVLTRGTLADPEMLGANPDAVFLMSLAELPVPAAESAAGAAEEGSVVRPRVWLGACAVDVATGQMLVGQWLDDDMRSQLRGVLTALQPAEMVLPQGQLSGSTRKVLLGMLRSPRVNELALGDKFWEAERAWRELREGGYYNSPGAMPPVLQRMSGDEEGFRAAGTALGGCLAYLRDVLLDKQVLSAGRVELLAEAFGVGAARAGGEAGPAYMSLDGSAMENLEVLENGDGGLAGTLLAAVDNCVTPAGRRRLRQWLCRPLYRIADIRARQDAVADLIGVAEEAAGQARKLFAGVADLERALARLTAAGAGHGAAREAPHVVLYEDVARKRVRGFAAVLRGLHRIQEAMRLFQDLSDQLSSTVLRALTTPGEAFPDMDAALRDMRDATDWDEAESSGRVVPRAGVDEAFDEAEGAIAVAEQNLQEYLQEVRGSISGCGPREVKYVSLNKESHVIEVPEAAKVPKDFEPMQGKKGIKRYTSPDLRQLVKARDEAFDQRERALSGILQGLTRLFAERKEVWAAAVDCTAQLDALMSLAVAAACSGGPMCRPNLVAWSEADGGSPIFRAKGLLHPAGLGGSGGVFVPNDVQLGGDAPPFVVLTGPNMGGKSTLLRQVCLACVLAQVGGWVPADSLDLSPVDSVFVRMGARDRIMLGQSTFFVELAETSAALNRATPRSLVALDELGRGTATSDGAAIAAAVLDYLAKEVKCRGLFATHYHRLSDSHASDPDVALMHMACEVTPAAEAGGVDEVTFLYKLVAGACPKSYGVNVARLAGLPDSVVRRAAQVAKQLEHHKVLCEATGAQQAQQQEAGAGGEQEASDAAGADPMDVDGAGGGAPEAVALLQRAVAAVQEAAANGGGSGGGLVQAVQELQGHARQVLAAA